jgi:hypothetical protein
VQRYATVGQGPTGAPAGIAIRYVVANPSSYAYFTADRPTAGGGFAPYPLDECHKFDQWKYGLEDLPAWLGDPGAPALERTYVRRDVTYLLGARDTDPELAALDRSCAAEAQGPTHLQRGLDFFRYLQARHREGLDQRLEVIPGVGHDAGAMLTADCALAAIYDVPVCGRRAPVPQAAAVPAVPVVAPVVAPVRMPVVVPGPPAPVRVHRARARHPVPVRVRKVEHRVEWRPAPVRHDLQEERRAAVFVPASWQFDGIGWVLVPPHWRPLR